MSAPVASKVTTSVPSAVDTTSVLAPTATVRGGAEVAHVERRVSVLVARFNSYSHAPVGVPTATKLPHCVSPAELMNVDATVATPVRFVEPLTERIVVAEAVRPPASRATAVSSMVAPGGVDDGTVHVSDEPSVCTTTPSTRTVILRVSRFTSFAVAVAVSVAPAAMVPPSGVTATFTSVGASSSSVTLTCVEYAAVRRPSASSAMASMVTSSVLTT